MKRERSWKRGFSVVCGVNYLEKLEFSIFPPKSSMKLPREGCEVVAARHHHSTTCFNGEYLLSDPDGAEKLSEKIGKRGKREDMERVRHQAVPWLLVHDSTELQLNHTGL